LPLPLRNGWRTVSSRVRSSRQYRSKNFDHTTVGRVKCCVYTESTRILKKWRIVGL